MNRGRARNDGRDSAPRGRGRSSRFAGRSAHRHSPAGDDGFSSNASYGNKDGSSRPGWQTSPQVSVGNISKQFDHISTSDSPNQRDCHFTGTKGISSGLGKLKLDENSLEAVTPGSTELCASQSAQSDLRDKDLNICKPKRRQMIDTELETGSSLSLDCLPAIDNARTLNEPSLVIGSGIKCTTSKKGSQFEPTPQKKNADHLHPGISDSLAVRVSFDICPVKTGKVVMLKAPLLVQNRMKRNEAKRQIEGQNIKVLRSGMLLLKSYISLPDQIKIVKKCRDLGIGFGGFYDPSYRDGGKLHLKMMCLGKNWDPETSMYGDQRPIDGAKPPLIPGEFCQLVKGAIQVSHSFLREQSKMPSVEHVLPSMSPSICIVNFYTKTGQLGLHQDKDETAESLKRKLPVVSFSIGDSAKFVFSDKRDPDNADKEVLESGDVLIFGGESRLIFHGVASILADTAPKGLMDKTNMLPGRLNLTFREY
ncbi:2-oxoglutarate-dependent dioxygenase family protein [Actinidia rufa]|uniref:2-oxoglutarate-dependent dioxygenase family protein n=1 Tax=Actinidia rufa TaxID=165716 RepID=A0A7J0GBH3_9ERIC|nr:2-oxoglutarate-dependent dioxygenase family protein [Actinidia rufa]